MRFRKRNKTSCTMTIDSDRTIHNGPASILYDGDICYGFPETNSYILINNTDCGTSTNLLHPISDYFDNTREEKKFYKCPNCGAPVTNRYECEYCGTLF